MPQCHCTHARVGRAFCAHTQKVQAKEGNEQARGSSHDVFVWLLCWCLSLCLSACLPSVCSFCAGSTLFSLLSSLPLSASHSSRPFATTQPTMEAQIIEVPPLECTRNRPDPHSLVLSALSCFSRSRFFWVLLDLL